MYTYIDNPHKKGRLCKYNDAFQIKISAKQNYLYTYIIHIYIYFLCGFNIVHSLHKKENLISLLTQNFILY